MPLEKSRRETTFFLYVCTREINLARFRGLYIYMYHNDDEVSVIRVFAISQT